MVQGVEPLHFGHLGHAWSAPGGPKIEHDDLTLEPMNRHRLTCHGVVECEVEWFTDFLENLERRLCPPGGVVVGEFGNEPVEDFQPPCGIAAELRGETA